MMNKKIVLYCKNVWCVTISFSSNASALYSQRGVCPCTESIFTAIYRIAYQGQNIAVRC